MAGLAFASGSLGGLYAKDVGTREAVIAIAVGLAFVLIGLIYSRRSEKKERAEVLEQEIRLKKKIEKLLAEEERTEENRKKGEAILSLWKMLSSPGAEEPTIPANPRSPRSPKRDP